MHIYQDYQREIYTKPGKDSLRIPTCIDTSHHGSIQIPFRYREMLYDLGIAIPRELQESEVIGKIGYILGVKNRLREKALRALVLACLLHDNYKPFTDNQSIWKSPAELTEEERRAMEPHALGGRKRVDPPYKSVGLKRDALDVVLPDHLAEFNVLGYDEDPSLASLAGFLIGNHHMISTPELTSSQQRELLGRNYTAYPYDLSSPAYQEELRLFEEEYGADVQKALGILQGAQFIVAVTNHERESIACNPWGLPRIIRGSIGIFGRNFELHRFALESLVILDRLAQNKVEQTLDEMRATLDSLVE